MAYVYILKSLKDNKKYIGSTINLRKRLDAHNNGYVRSTKSRRPLILTAYQSFNSIQEAAYYEKIYKKSHDYLDRMIEQGKITLVSDGD